MILYKFKSNADFSHILDILINERLFLADWKRLNDPMEASFNFILAPKDEDRWKKFESILNGTRVCSLSTTYNTGLLWAHYANGYKGVAIEVDIPDSEPRLKKVRYVKRIPDIGDSWRDYKRAIATIMAKKFLDWRNESEYRLVSADGAAYHDIKGRIRKVIVGHRMPNHQFDILQWTCRHLDIDIQGIDNSEDGRSICRVDLKHLHKYCSGGEP